MAREEGHMTAKNKEIEEGHKVLVGHLCGNDDQEGSRL